ncbi:MAG: hypothetical protein ACYTAQ_02135 [Planctomycetota bacterium]
MSEGAGASSPDGGDDHLEQARRDKLRRWRDEYGVEPYGRRVDGLGTPTRSSHWRRIRPRAIRRPRSPTSGRGPAWRAAVSSTA